MSEQLDRRLAQTAYRKVVQGEKLSSEERAALKRYEREQEEARRWEYYRSIPPKHWRQMSGRQAKVILDQARRYGIPFDDNPIDLPKVVRALHDFFAENSYKLTSGNDALLQGDDGSPALERYREERAALARLDRLEREGMLVARDTVRDGLGRIASILRAAGETLERQFGPTALEVLHEALDEAEAEVARVFGDVEAMEGSGGA